MKVIKTVNFPNCEVFFHFGKLSLCVCFCVFTTARVSNMYFLFCVFPVCYCLVVSTSAINCLESLVSKMTCYVLSGTFSNNQQYTTTTTTTLLLSIGLQGDDYIITAVWVTSVEVWFSNPEFLLTLADDFTV